MENKKLEKSTSLVNEKRYYFTDEIGQQSTKLIGLITSKGYFTYADLMYEIASKFDICLGEETQNVLYVTSSENYEKILKELDKVRK